MAYVLRKNSHENSYNFDLYSKIPYATLDQAERERLWDDGLHLTGEGYKMMGDVIAIRLYEIMQDLAKSKQVATTVDK